MGHSKQGSIWPVRVRVPLREETKLYFLGEALAIIYEPVRSDKTTKELDKLLEKIK